MHIISKKKFKKIRKAKRRFFKFMRPLADIKLLIFAIAVVMVWRGVWNLTDEYFLPTHPIASNILSIFVGVLILFLSDSRLGTLVGVSDCEGDD